MFAFYNKVTDSYMYVDASLGVVPHTDDECIEYSFSSLSDILYTSNDRSVLERILNREVPKGFKGDWCDPYYTEELKGYEIVQIGKIEIPEEKYIVRYVQSTLYEETTTDFIGTPTECLELINSTIRHLSNINKLDEIKIIDNDKIIHIGLFDVMKFFMSKVQ